MSAAKMESRLLQAILSDPQMIQWKVIASARPNGGVIVAMDGQVPMLWEWRDGMFQLTPPDPSHSGPRDYETIAEAILATRHILAAS